MPRLASLYFPFLPIERIRREENGNRPQPEVPAPAPLRAATADTSPAVADAYAARADCSCPRGGEWRPGARWAENSKERLKLVQLKERMQMEADIAALPPHQQPSMRELGRRTEAMAPVFRGSAATPPSLSSQAMGAVGAAAPLVTIHRVGQRQVVAAVSPEAQALGLTSGMAVAQARVLAPGLVLRDASPDADRALLERLALFAARRWTPRAALSGQDGLWLDGLWLDLTGVAHLFGGEEALCRRIVRFCRRLGLTARLAVAGTYGAAHALARHGAGPLVRVPSGTEAAHLASLPVAALRLDEPAQATARRLGLDKVGDLLALPRAPLYRRFGALLPTRLDQALGNASEPIDPVVPEDPPAVLLRFMEPIGTAEHIAEAITEAMRQLVPQLRAQGLGVRRLLLRCERVDNVWQDVRIGTARATRDGAHLLRLLLPRIETIDPGFGIERLHLVAARVEPLGAEALPSALAGAGPAPDLVPLIDCLAGRLGLRRLYRVGSVESDVPERSLRKAPPLEPVSGWACWPRPVRLLARPERLDNVVALLPDQPPRRFTWRGRSCRVTRADGPERIYGEWWKRTAEVPAVRDYFQVELEDGARLWLFRRGDGENPATGDLSWWMQGGMA